MSLPDQRPACNPCHSLISLTSSSVSSHSPYEPASTSTQQPRSSALLNCTLPCSTSIHSSVSRSYSCEPHLAPFSAVLCSTVLDSYPVTPVYVTGGCEREVKRLRGNILSPSEHSVSVERRKQRTPRSGQIRSGSVASQRAAPILGYVRHCNGTLAHRLSLHAHTHARTDTHRETFTHSHNRFHRHARRIEAHKSHVHIPTPRRMRTPPAPRSLQRWVPGDFNGSTVAWRRFFTERAATPRLIQDQLKSTEPTGREERNRESERKKER